MAGLDTFRGKVNTMMATVKVRTNSDYVNLIDSALLFKGSVNEVYSQFLEAIVQAITNGSYVA